MPLPRVGASFYHATFDKGYIFIFILEEHMTNLPGMLGAGTIYRSLLLFHSESFIAYQFHVPCVAFLHGVLSSWLLADSGSFLVGFFPFLAFSCFFFHLTFFLFLFLPSFVFFYYFSFSFFIFYFVW